MLESMQVKRQTTHFKCKRIKGKKKYIKKMLPNVTNIGTKTQNTKHPIDQ